MYAIALIVFVVNVVSNRALHPAIKISLISWTNKIIAPANIWLLIIENNINEAAIKWCKRY